MKSFEPRPVPRVLIVAGVAAGFDLYLHVGDRYVLYSSRHEPIPEESLERLDRGGVDTLYVLAGDGEQLESYVAAHLEQHLERTAVPRERGAILRESTYSLLRSPAATEDGRLSARLRAASDLTARQLASDAALLPGMTRIAVGDQPAQVVRAVNIATYAVALTARQPGADTELLSRVGVEALSRIEGPPQSPAVARLRRIEASRATAIRRPNGRSRAAPSVAPPEATPTNVVSLHMPSPQEQVSERLHQGALAVATTFETLTNPRGGQPPAVAAPGQAAQPTPALGPFSALRLMARRAEPHPGLQPLILDFARLLVELHADDPESPVSPLWRRMGPRVA